ncbi:MAG: hypothetical protein A2481_04395 [Candidatus Yonathbacteria bacterium RIFOXYC2_FULL_47_9]|nr:MAG: hypothetical protein A2481_04395 [Candidatus Yonathbacteria bacterium RIFOXYC2_FULL_47_9]HAT68832.1 hypothetical protein [Candidatus Yonathbacteria bacterium]
MNIPISYQWLKSHFDKEIPSPEEVSTLFMKHLCEVEGAEQKGDDTIFDLKIMPDRGHDLLAHRGIAHEVSVLAGVPMKEKAQKEISIAQVTPLRVAVENAKLCPRYMGRVIEGVRVTESPAWLRERLESVGQRSINNIVDITNYVMLELGQPMHAFDMGKLARTEDGAISLVVRPAEVGEQMMTLDNKDLSLISDTLVIADTKRVLAIAGVKGGKGAGVNEGTTAIVFEAANFDAVSTRKTSARVGIRTDSSRRFEHDISPALAGEAMSLATELLIEMCPDAKVGEVVDVLARPLKNYKVGIALSELNGILGTTLSDKEVKDILARLGFVYEVVDDPRTQVVVMAPTLVDKPYKFGASVLYDAPEAFDCASFTAYLWKEAGVAIPRMSVDQLVFGDEVILESAQPGDLIFSNSGTDNIYYESKEWMKGTKVPEGVDHVGLYLGDGKLIHASRYNKNGVALESVAESARFRNIVGVRRIAIPAEPRYVVTVPLERLDLRIKEDLAEEIGRVYGFDKIISAPLSDITFDARILKSYHYANVIRDTLVAQGFSEVFTYSFQNEGEFAVANPIAEDKGFLRPSLHQGLMKALELSRYNAPLLGLDEIKIFEIGKVYPGVMKEELSCGVGAYVAKSMKQSKREERTKEIFNEVRQAIEDVLGVKINDTQTSDAIHFNLGALLEKLPEPKSPAPFKAVSVRYEKSSAYPFMLRDIAMWAQDITQDEILAIIRTEGTDLLVRDRLFDVFTKEFDGVSKTSYAFNLVFQSPDRTLSDVEINEVMARITEKLSARGLEVR